MAKPKVLFQTETFEIRNANLVCSCCQDEVSGEPMVLFDDVKSDSVVRLCRNCLDQMYDGMSEIE